MHINNRATSLSFCSHTHTCYLLWGNLPLHSEMGHYLYWQRVCVWEFECVLKLINMCFLINMYFWFPCLHLCSLLNCWWYSDEICAWMCTFYPALIQCLCDRGSAWEQGVVEVGGLRRSKLVGGGFSAISTGDTMKVTRQKDLIAPFLFLALWAYSSFVPWARLRIS